MSVRMVLSAMVMAGALLVAGMDRTAFAQPLQPSRTNSPCPNAFTEWYGAPYLNRFYFNNDQGNCILGVLDLTIAPGVSPVNPVSVNLGSQEWIQEARVIVGEGGSLTGNAGS